MAKLHHSVNFSDQRGTITDLLADVDSVTEIFTRKGGIRGNHVHNFTVQWTYVVSGSLEVVSREGDVLDIEGFPGSDEIVRETLAVGDLWVDMPTVAHAWRALEDTLVLVFTKGPRSGANYESDTVKLDVPLI